MASASSAKIVKMKCSQCKSFNQHEILSRESEEEQSEDIWYEVQLQILRCMGCRLMSFRKLVMSSDDYDDEGKPEVFVTCCPEPEERQAVFPAWQLPHSVGRLYRETLTAFNHKAMILASAGLRSVVEATCADQACEGNNLKTKIDKLVENGVLLKRDADYLHQHRFLGNEAVHEMHEPPAEEFTLALEILEHFLRTLYIVPELDTKLRKLRSKRGAQVD